MSQLSELTGSAVADLVPGYRLARLDLKSIGVVEEHLQRFYLEAAIQGSTGLPVDERRDLLQAAHQDAQKNLVFLTAEFERALRSYRGKLLALMTSINMTHPNATQKEMEAAVNRLSRDDSRRALEWVFGWDVPPKKAGGQSDAADQPASSNSTGQTSPAES